MDRFDRYWIGIAAGIVLPAVFGLVYIDVMNLWYPLRMLQFDAGSILNKLLMVSVFPDLALIFVFYTLDAWKTSKGLLIGAMPYILAMIALSFCKQQCKHMKQSLLIYSFRALCAVLFFLLQAVPSMAQQVEDRQIEAVRRNPQYIWGQGTGETLQAADDNAMRDLTSQIVVNVDSRTETQIQNEVQGSEVSSSQSTSSDLRVSSNVSLSNLKRIVSDHGSYVVVLRYVERSEIEKMFDARKAKISDLVLAGELAEDKAKVSDALRNYYWALKLIGTIPEEHRTTLVTDDGQMLSTELSEQIASILDSIAIETEQVDEAEGGKMVQLQIKYMGKPVPFCDFTYFDGYDWIGSSAKNGHGAVELPSQAHEVRIRIEYEFSKLWKSDPMVNDQLTQMPSRIPFPQFDKQVSIAAAASAPSVQATSAKMLAKEMEVDSLAAVNKKEVRNQAEIIYPVLKAIDERDYDDVEELFTENGYKWFKKLIKYGNARIIARDNIQVSAFAEGYLLRGVRARFNFKKNDKTFVEDLVFYIKDEKIEGINFGLEQGALEDIRRHEQWDARSRLVLINFLENYKTAYALERLDYLEAVFSDDALIIVGNKIPEQHTSEIRTEDTERYEHNKLTKSQYMAQLERVFAKQEYVNIHFEDAAVKKTSRNDERYEIIIKQNYYSTTYADKGYLYLLADISNPEQPIIHVRVWDENRNNLMNYGEWIF